MLLKATVESLDQVEEQYRPLYAEKDGVFRLNVEGVEFEDDVKGLRTALDKERKARRDAEKRLGTLPEDFDPEKWAELTEAEKRREVEEAERKGEFEKVKSAIAEKWQKEVAKRDEQLAQRDGFIHTLVVDNELTGALAKVGVLDEYREAAKALLEKKRPSVVNDEGQYTGIFKTDAGDVPVGEFVKMWAETPEAAPFLKGSGAGGSGAPGRGAAGGSGRSGVRTKADIKSMADRIAFIEEHGNKAYLDLPAA